MDSLQQLNAALDYIERRLEEEIDIAEAARIAVCSEYHFRRVFSFLAGVPLSEYVRRRRLTLAADELTQGTGRIIDIALKYGYGSPDAFTKAFCSLHGVTPAEARGSGVPLKAYPRMSFRLTVQGGDPMDYRIESKEAFRVAGLMKRVPVIYEGVNPHIAEMWQSLTPERIAALKELSDTDPQGLISASCHFSEARLDTGADDHGQLDHYIGAATTKAAEKLEPEWQVLEVPAGLWAVFTAVGAFPSALQDIWGRIYSEWLPSSRYEVAPGPEMLWNEHKDTSRPDYRSEIWLPVQLKPVTGGGA